MNDERNHLAGEYALGLLDGAERAEAHHAVASDAEFWAAVTVWRARLMPLLDEVEPVSPPEKLWPQIERSLGVANDNARSSNGDVRWWRRATAGASLLAASLAMVLLIQPFAVPTPPPSVPRTVGPPLVAMIGDETATKIVANWDPESKRLILAVAGAMPEDRGKTHELWVIPKGGDPRSLGAMRDHKTMSLDLAQTLARLIDQGATIAISVEPAGGSTTGKPTGPVIASGTFETT